KWFFDENGQVKGLTQQPWIGQLIDIPIDKLLLFRPSAHKNNPEGRSVLRNAYRSWFFTKRLEEQEAILIERMNGFPVIYVPSRLMRRLTPIQEVRQGRRSPHTRRSSPTFVSTSRWGPCCLPTCIRALTASRARCACMSSAWSRRSTAARLRLTPIRRSLGTRSIC